MWPAVGRFSKSGLIERAHALLVYGYEDDARIERGARREPPRKRVLQQPLGAEESRIPEGDHDDDRGAKRAQEGAKASHGDIILKN